MDVATRVISNVPRLSWSDNRSVANGTATIDMDNDVDVAIFLYLSLKLIRQKRNKKRKWWVHPINSARLLHGCFYTLYPLLRQDPVRFFNYFRMSQSSFDELLTKIKGSITLQNTNMRSAIPPEEMLALSLRYLASGCSLREIHYGYRVGRSTAGGIIQFVYQRIWLILKNECIPKPNAEKWKQIAAGFNRKANFPHCLGAVDGKHIRLVKPQGSATSYFNYKQYFSINLMAVADANHRFIYVDVGSYGKDADSTIFEKCSLWQGIENDSLDIPPSEHIPGIDIAMPYAFIGDDAFALSKYLLKPYAGKYLSVNKRIFNYRLSRARRFVECTFGILSNKWRILHRPIDVNIDFATDIVKCCCVLHNFVRERDGFEFEDTLTIQGLEENLNQDDNSRGVNRSVNLYREKLSTYFVSNHGQLPWQNDKI